MREANKTAKRLILLIRSTHVYVILPNNATLWCVERAEVICPERPLSSPSVGHNLEGRNEVTGFNASYVSHGTLQQESETHDVGRESHTGMDVTTRTPRTPACRSPC